MFRNTFSTVKKWILSLQRPTETQEITDLGIIKEGIQDPLSFQPENQEETTVLDQDTANEIVVTWNLLNPP